MGKNILMAVKNRLRITWNYQDDEIIELIEEAEAFIKSRVTIDKIEDNQNAYKLLKEYCRYAWSGSANQFPIDYKNDILNLQIEVAQKEREKDDKKE